MTTPVWTATGSVPNVTAGALIIGDRYEKLNVECRLSGTGVANVLQLSELWARPAGGGTARQVFWADKQPNPNTGGSSVFGQVTGLAEGTSYDVDLILSDGTNVQHVVALAQTTKTSPSSPATLIAAPTRYVREDGSDSNAGTANTSGGAWRTPGKAFASAPTGAVVLVQGGAGGKFYPRMATARGAGLGALTLVSSHPAADDTDRANGGPQDANPGAHAIVCEWKVNPTAGPGLAGEGTLCATAPAAETDTRFQGPNGSKWTLYTHSTLGYTCYVWDAPGTPTASTQWVTWSATKTGTLEKIGVYAQQAGVVDSADAACELLNTIRDAPFGAVYLTISATSGENSKLYLKLPPHAAKADGTPTSDPNDLYVWAGGGSPGDSKGLFELQVATPNIRISGLELRNCIHGVYLVAGCDNLIVDHCEFRDVFVGVMARGTQNGAVNSTYADNVLIDHTRTLMTNLWSEDQVNRPSYPWEYIKGVVGKTGQAGAIWKKTGGTTTYGNRRLANNCETDGCWGKGGASNLTFRNNLVDGVFNGISGDHTGFDHMAMYGLEAYGNLFTHLADDTFEPEKSVSNWECRDNRTEGCVVGVSTASHERGPILIYRNVWYRIGLQGMRSVARDISGQNFPTAGFWKYKGSLTSAPLAALVNNTVHIVNPMVEWMPTGYSPRNSDGRFSAGGGDNVGAVRFYERNNIIMGANRDTEISGSPGGNASATAAALQWDEDYNYRHTTADGPNGAGRGLAYAGTNYTTMAAYRTATTHGATKPQQGTHSNDGLPGGGLSNTTFTVSPYTAPNNQFAGDPQAGYRVLALTSISVFRAAGVVVPGLMDRAGVDYAGALPDLGAMQYGLGSAPSLPAAPTGLTATKSGSSIINLAWTDAATDETSYVVERSLNGVDGWLVLATIAAGSSAYSDTGLPGLATRSYRVGAVNAAGTSYGGVATATTDASSSVPAQPTSLLAVPLSSSSIGLTWQDNASDETSYRVKRSSNGASFSTLATLGINASAYVDTGLSASATWYYQVVAVNAIGDSTPSATSVATTLPASGSATGGRTTRERSTAARTLAARTTR